MNTLNFIMRLKYVLLHQAPDVLSKAVCGFSDSKEKRWLRESNDKLREQISEMRPAYVNLNKAMKGKKKTHEDEIKELQNELSKLKQLSQKAQKIKLSKKSTSSLSTRKNSKR